MQQMIYTPTSSNIYRFAWQGGVLYVQFKSNMKVYQYDGVPSTVFDEMRVAESVGSYFHSRIRKEFTATALDDVQSTTLGFESVTMTPG